MILYYKYITCGRETHRDFTAPIKAICFVPEQL